MISHDVNVGIMGAPLPVMFTSIQSASIVPSLINNEADDESSSDSSSDDSDDSSETSDDKSTSDVDVNVDTTKKHSVGTILDMDIANNSHVMQFNKLSSSSSGVAEGLEDLVMAPIVANRDDIKRPTSIDDESGAWKEFVRPELSGGLYVKMRFVRGGSRVREAQIMGLDPKTPCTVCLQVHIENM
jgi:AP-3 complex subunit beta